MTVGVSAEEVKTPRVSDVPSEVSPDGYKSKIVKRYERTSRKTQESVQKAVHGGTFDRGLRAGVSGSWRERRVRLAANAIVRLKSRWEDEYREWRSRRLDSRWYAYIWADRCVPGSRCGSGEDSAAVRGGSE